MAILDRKDRARNVCSTSSTGTLTLGDNATGAQSIKTMTTGHISKFYFAKGSQWITFEGTFTAPDQLARTRIIDGSGGLGVNVDFAVGQGEVGMGVPSEELDAMNLIEVVVASAATCDIGAAYGKRIELQGTAGITSFGTSKNKERRVRYTGAGLTVTASATLVLPGSAATLALQTNDAFDVSSDGTATPIWTLSRVFPANGKFYSPVDGTAALPAFTWPGDPDTGIYHIGANNVGVSANGAKVLDIATTGLVVTGNLSIGGPTVTGSGLGLQVSGAQPALVMQSTTSAATKQMARFVYDGAIGLTNPGFLFQGLDDSGGFTSNDNVFWRGGGISIGNITFTPGLIVGAPTGGNKGAGTINATAVYDDNVLLTCMALEYLNTGKIDTDYWDSTVPDRVIPAEIIKACVEQVPVMEDVSIVETVLEPIDGGYVAREETKTVSQQVSVYAPVFDADGNGIDAIKELVFETKEIPEQIIRAETIEPRVHELAHTFKAMVDGGFDPLSPAAYIAKLKKDQALPGMPTREDWEHGAHSVGEIHNRLWLATELLAMTVVGLSDRIAALEEARS